MNSPSQFMPLALAQAQLAVGLSDPNPRVGCVIVSAAGQQLGAGHTQAVGGAHAEIMALRDAASKGLAVTGATAYVTLEPCSHQGHTGPCCDALAAAGIRKLVASSADPNPLVAGQGFARLRAAGLDVVVGPGAAEARELNLGFFSRMQRQRPWVRLKLAASLDGKTALESGVSQWITSEAARADGHAWRVRASAVLTGVGTVRQDNPRLDVRLAGTPRQPWAVVVDSRLDCPLDAAILIPGRPLVIYCAVHAPERQAALEARGVTVVASPGPGGKVDLAAVMRDLALREVNELQVEAGSKLNGSLVRAGLVDELLVYLAPKLLGPGQGMAQLQALADLDQAVALDFLSAAKVGPDLRIVARLPGHENF